MPRNIHCARETGEGFVCELGRVGTHIKPINLWGGVFCFFTPASQYPALVGILKKILKGEGTFSAALIPIL